MLEEGVSDHRHKCMVVKALPGSSLEVIKTEFFFHLLAQLEVERTQCRSRFWAESVESPGGISPPGAPKTVREPLDSHGSRCSAVSMT
jgi:hypothetical protein